MSEFINDKITDAKQRIAFEQAVDFLTEMIRKYGDRVDTVIKEKNLKLPEKQTVTA